MKLSSIRHEMKLIIFNYMSKGLFLLRRESNISRIKKKKKNSPQI